MAAADRATWATLCGRANVIQIVMLFCVCVQKYECAGLVGAGGCLALGEVHTLALEHREQGLAGLKDLEVGCLRLLQGARGGGWGRRVKR